MLPFYEKRKVEAGSVCHGAAQPMERYITANALLMRFPLNYDKKQSLVRKMRKACLFMSLLASSIKFISLDEER